MRTKKILLFLLLLTLFFLSVTSHAQDKNDPVFVLDINLKSDGKSLHDYVIYLGKHEDSVAIKRSKEVYVTLKRNENYSFKFHKEGYHDLTLELNTSLPDEVHSDELFILSFEMSLKPVNADLYLSDAKKCISYDQKAEDFSLCAN